MTERTLRSQEAPGRSLRDRLRTEKYLTRLDWHLEGVMAGKQRRATIRELRVTLASDPRDTATTLGDLGPPQVLAQQYGEQGARRPQWSMGIIAAGLALLVYWTVFLSFAFGMLAVVDSNAPGEAQAPFFFVDVTAYSTADAFGIGWSSGWSWILLPAAVAAVSFLLAARAWRIVTSRHTYT